MACLVELSSFSNYFTSGAYSRVGRVHTNQSLNFITIIIHRNTPAFGSISSTDISYTYISQTMSVNTQALQQLLIEMDNQLNKTQAELSMCNLQLDRVTTNLSLIKSTSSSLNNLCDVSGREKVYQGVGKAFIQKDVKTYLDEIKEDEKGFLDNKKNLELKKNYLDTTLEKTVENMKQIVGK